MAVFINTIFMLLLATACEPRNPLASLQQKLERFPEYAIMLNDMRREGNFFSNYFHQYKIVVNSNKDAAAHEQLLSDWLPVSAAFYRQHANNLGMVLVAKTAGGEKSNIPQPPGYQYLGNPQYGRWVERDGTSFWEFYGKYALLSSVFGMLHHPIYYRDYNVYRDHHRRGRPYYGSRGQFGSNGSETRKKHSNFFQRRQRRENLRRQAFGQRVRQRATRSHHSGFRRGGWGFGK